MTFDRPTSVISALLATLSLGAISMLGCSQDGDDASRTARPTDIAPFKVRVTITAAGYRPRHVRVRVGGQVTWINRDPKGQHTAETPRGVYDDLPGGENQSFDTHTLSWLEPYTVTFHKPGSYDYSSSYDVGPEWNGKIDVLSPQPPDSR